jgi:polysaccharide export outer membrane protein
MLKKLFLLIIVLASLSSCRILNPSLMLKPTKADSLSNMTNSAYPDYRIAPNDLVEFSITPNAGNNLIDINMQDTKNRMSKLPYLVEQDGNIRLPVIGRVHIAGLTVKEAIIKIEEAYSQFYVEPFVTLTVLNRRVIVFPGSGGTARVITLQNENMTLIETIALAGGIPETGKAYRIRLLRRNAGKTQVQLIDLSTLAGMPEANMVMQANDIIYVEPAVRYPQALLAQITPYISLLTTFILVYTIVKPK